ncbi:hypothetical protein ACWKSP_09840 [Micromonosporaceae bacterium Da 78-11]
MADEVSSTDEARSDELSGGTGESAWVVLFRAIRALCGAISLVLGLLWILLNTTQGNAGRAHGTDIAVGVVLTAGGLVLLMPHRIRLPRRATAITAGVVGVGGTLAGLTVKSAQLCCMFAYLIDRGWPFHWVERGGVADDSVTAYRLAQGADWDVNYISLLANLVLWAYAGMLLVVIAVLVQRARRGHDEPRR